jgi:hypothetical protein
VLIGLPNVTIISCCCCCCSTTCTPPAVSLILTMESVLARFCELALKRCHNLSQLLRCVMRATIALCVLKSQTHGEFWK